MTITLLLTIAAFLTILIILSLPLSRLLVRLIDGELPHHIMQIEKKLWRCGTVKPKEMTKYQYILAILVFNLCGLILLFVLLMTQAWLPLNPEKMPNLSWHLALNTAASFITNTNWQAYSGENTLSYFSQMVGLTVQNFLSAATGIAVALVFIRAFSRKLSPTVGNAWVDLTRIIIYLLLPLSLLLALFFVSQGVIQNVSPYLHLTTLEGVPQVLPMGPVASQEAIKLLGTNGGGFFGANSAHPFENPTALSNMAQMLAIFLIPCTLCMAFGRAVSDTRQSNALLWCMSLIFIVAVIAVFYAELNGPDYLAVSGLSRDINMEGKESRFGLVASVLYAVVTTAASCGAVNAMHDSFTALGGMVPLWLMQIGEVIFGGVGSGLYGMLLFVLLTVFVSGLMIGRSPEYLGKKIESSEIKMTALAILVTPTLVLVGTALAVSVDAGKTAILNPGAHGFTEILYALSSAANNNGSAFAGLSVNTPFYNLLLALVMLVGRFGVIVPVLAIAGSLAEKKQQPASSGTLPTHGPVFICLLIGTILLVGALTFVPALALGPIAEYLQF
ncbi:potassium-transporting ATPase subunit KdpA [Budviciaceae bacterium CWB-B4]|uniref:Potassium-transporting ATPase potassium-binding subunit n=1 Tax=Limnobaculum xujianqingii TaxID=2738837 RepID=A0A9D7AEY4_9GAMM|nr:potassium-transporting ATPase subunit KdpA [Limnobaculum xujianqingii]MBK5071442.1 potassium-transporting ATPase subunit KdpA [Limnobaculum xujianqingii]MBK5174751.1 potassium-transporting ATPase subunit KdpA [Limnobaculum xujianqingii]